MQIKSQAKTQSLRDRLRKRSKLGFSLVELIVVVAIMAVLVAVLAPSLLSYVERSRAQKDASAMGEVANAFTVALSDAEVYDAVLDHSVQGNVAGYIDNVSETAYDGKDVELKAGEGADRQYTFGDDARQLDETSYWAAGNMRGVTITFAPTDGVYVLEDGIINKYMPTDNTTKLSACPELYDAVKAIVGDEIAPTSQTYRNSEYTVFIRIGSMAGVDVADQEALQVYGQYNGTNLPAVEATRKVVNSRTAGSDNDNAGDGDVSVEATPGATFSILKSNDCHSYFWEHTDDCYLKETIFLTWDQLRLAENGVQYGYNASAITDTTIDESAFFECFLLKNITIQDGITTIGDTAFNWCYSLESIILPSSVTSIGNGAFSNCTSLTSITLPSSITTIGDTAFECCCSLESITLSSSLVTIGEYTFNCCCSLESITLPSSVTNIGNGAFQNCASLTSITLPSSITTIGEYTFTCCCSLESINLPSSLVTISGNAFTCCCSLGSITIPSSVTTMGEFAFGSCEALTQIRYEGTMAQWNNIHFVPDRYGDIYWNCGCPEITVTCTDDTIKIPTVIVQPR